MKKIFIIMIMALMAMTSMASQSDNTTAPTFKGWRVYLDNTASWTSPYCYSWNATNKKISGAWPGTVMTKDAETEYYYIDFAEEPANVIFNNGNGTQTADLVFNNGYLYTCSGSSQPYATPEPEETDMLTLADMSIECGETAYLEISLEKIHPVSQMSFKVVLPTGLKYESVKRSDRLSAHDVSVRQIAGTGNAYAVTILSDSNAEITGGEGILLSLGVKATTSGERTATISKITVATNGTAPERYALDDTTAAISITGEDIDAISSVELGGNKVEGIYSINGGKINAMQRGINIIRMTDGSVRKITVE